MMEGTENSEAAHRLLSSAAASNCRVVIDVEAELTAAEVEMMCAEVNSSLYGA
jgi:hypothetical protein